MYYVKSTKDWEGELRKWQFFADVSPVFTDVGGWVKFRILTSLSTVNLDTLTFFPEYEVT